MTRLESLRRWRQHFREDQADNREQKQAAYAKDKQLLGNYYEGREAAVDCFLIVLNSLIDMEEIRDGNA